MGNQTFRKTYESGSWFEIQSMAFSIIDRAANGQDTSRSREVLKAWRKYPGYRKAGEVSSVVDTLLPDGKAVAEKELQVIKDRITKILRPTIYETTELDRGRPRLSENLSRTTLWRREKEQQGVLVG